MDEYFWVEMREQHPDWTDAQILEYATNSKDTEKDSKSLDDLFADWVCAERSEREFLRFALIGFGIIGIEIAVCILLLLANI